MGFPDAPRVIYEINPLEEVICQLRFPPVLKIDTEVPAMFQDRVRAEYPFYQSKPTVQLPSNLPPEFAAIVAQSFPGGTGRTAHEFSSGDKSWTLSLTREFLALTCRSYRRWEEFKAHLGGPMAALLEVYAPPVFTRIGLRYRDVIRRSVLGLERAGWDELLQPWVAGPFASAAVAADLEHSASEILVRLPGDGGRVRAHHGLVTDEPAEEICYLLDADFFDDRQTETSHATDHLDFLNQQARLFFRWCITDRLHESLRPRPLPGD